MRLTNCHHQNKWFLPNMYLTIYQSLNAKFSCLTSLLITPIRFNSLKSIKEDESMILDKISMS